MGSDDLDRIFRNADDDVDYFGYLSNFGHPAWGFACQLKRSGTSSEQVALYGRQLAGEYFPFVAFHYPAVFDFASYKNHCRHDDREPDFPLAPVYLLNTSPFPKYALFFISIVEAKSGSMAADTSDESTFEFLMARRTLRSE